MKKSIKQDSHDDQFHSLKLNKKSTKKMKEPKLTTIKIYDCNFARFFNTS